MKTKRLAASIRDMAYTALFAAALCVAAPFSLYVGPIPLSFATLVIYIAAGALEWKASALSVVLYVLSGAVGLPVFTGFEGGFQKLVGVTGGFIIGYIPCALAAGLIIDFSRKNLRSYVLGMITGTLLLYTCGTAWFMVQTRSSFAVSFALCVAPFLAGDAVKIILACVAAPQLRKALEKQ